MVQERCENCKWFFLRDAGSFWSKSDFVKKKIFSLNKICFKQYNSIISAVWKFVNDSIFFQKKTMPIHVFCTSLVCKITFAQKCTETIYNFINTNAKCVILNSIMRWISKIAMRGYSGLILPDVLKYFQSYNRNYCTVATIQNST